MASWLRSLWKNPKNAIVETADSHGPALLAAEYHGVYGEGGQCLALPKGSYEGYGASESFPVEAVPDADQVCRPVSSSFSAKPWTYRPLRVVVISDTHEFHRGLQLPPGDILLHCGDVLTIDRFNPGVISNYNTRDFFSWFNQQPFALRVVIAGNHDHQFEKLGKEKIKALAWPSIYLEDELLDVGGLRIFGTPRSTANSRGSGNVAFQRFDEVKEGIDVWPKTLPTTALQLQPVDEERRRGGETFRLAEVPTSSLPSPNTVHFFMTHGSLNCRRVRASVASIAPSLHLSGHVHEMHGAWVLTHAGECEHFDAASLDKVRTVCFNGASTGGKPMRERLRAPIVFDFQLNDVTAVSALPSLTLTAPDRIHRPFERQQ